MAPEEKDGSSGSGGLSERTQKQIDELPKHAQEIFKSAHASALEQYRDPDKRRDPKDDPEEIAHRVAWDAVKNKYEKKGDKWVSKK
ncbi:MAG: ChaB family protein [Thermoproteota archaeon]